MPDGRAELHVENARLRNALARAEARAAVLEGHVRALIASSEIVADCGYGSGRSVAAGKCVLCGDHTPEGDVVHKNSCPVPAARDALANGPGEGGGGEWPCRDDDPDDPLQWCQSCLTRKAPDEGGTT